MEWWKKTIVYECYLKSFLDTTGSGTGDLKGLTSELDYLSSLGVGAIWLTPVYRSPMVDNGYDIADYYTIDPSYGTMEDMAQLIQEANERDIEIVMDLVLNHTSNENAWFKESASSRTNPKSDWYIWRDAKADGSAPTNWRSIFGGSAWEWCEERKQYYLHTFAPAQPDLNWANPEVREEVARITNYWIDQGVGGFRVDAITYIKKPELFMDGPVDGEDGLSAIHNMTANTPGILAYLNEYAERTGHQKKDGKEIFYVAEANGVSADELHQWVGEKAPFDMLFEFSHVNLQFPEGEIWCRSHEWEVKDLKNALEATQNNTKTNGWAPVFFENHDQPRSIQHFFPHGTNTEEEGRLLAVLLMTLRGTPYLYQGEELGMCNVKWDDIERYNDISSKGQYAFALEEGFSKAEAIGFVQTYSRDNARTPMQWNNEKNAGFTTGTPWLSVHEDYAAQNVAEEEKNPESILRFYCKLASFRKEHPVLLEGSYESVDTENPNLYVFERRTEDTCIVTALNFSSEVQRFAEPSEHVLLSSQEHETGKLKPYEAVIYQKI